MDVLDTTLRYLLTEYGYRHPMVTTQEFILRYYYRDQHPDLLIWAPPFAHAVHLARNGYKKVSLDVQYLVSLVNLYMPNESDIMWIPVPRIRFKPQPTSPFNSYKGLSVLSHLQLMNEALFRAIKDDLLTGSGRITAFYDPISLTCDLTRPEYSDRVHYKPFYYRTMIQHMLQMKCLG